MWNDVFVIISILCIIFMIIIISAIIVLTISNFFRSKTFGGTKALMNSILDYCSSYLFAIMGVIFCVVIFDDKESEHISMIYSVLMFSIMLTLSCFASVVLRDTLREPPKFTERLVQNKSNYTLNKSFVEDEVNDSKDTISITYEFEKSHYGGYPKMTKSYEIPEKFGYKLTIYKFVNMALSLEVCFLTLFIVALVASVYNMLEECFSATLIYIYISVLIIALVIFGLIAIRFYQKNTGNSICDQLKEKKKKKKEKKKKKKDQKAIQSEEKRETVKSNKKINKRYPESAVIDEFDYNSYNLDDFDKFYTNKCDKIVTKDNDFNESKIDEVSDNSNQLFDIVFLTCIFINIFTRIKKRFSKSN